MFIPYGTDAPIYYWPWATGTMVVVNVVVMILQYLNPDGVPPYEAYLEFQLVYADGVHPIQWLTSNFMHLGALHLIGNMVFLLIFGLIVEGKVGPWLFTAIYIGIGVVSCALQQLAFLTFPEYTEMYSVGASGAIYGLIAIAMIWAPQDHIKMVLIFNAMFSLVLMKAIAFDLPILMFGLFYVIWDFTIASFSGFTISTSLLHTVGAAVGLVTGVVFVLSSWVDCEQRDLVSMFRELAGYAPVKKKLTRSEKEALQEQKRQRIEQRKENLLLYRRSMAAHISAGNPEAAVKTFRQIQKLDQAAIWEQAELLSLISAFQKKSNWDSTILYSRQYLETHDENRGAVAINLAKILLLEKHSPRKAMDVIRGMGDLNQLPAKQKAIVKQIVAKGNKMIAEGAIELD